LSGSFSPKECLACSKAAYLEGNPSKIALAENLFPLRDEGHVSVLKLRFLKFGVPGSRVEESKMEDCESLKRFRKLIESAGKISLTNNKATKPR
jgi:hypothetical protein